MKEKLILTVLHQESLFYGTDLIDDILLYQLIFFLEYSKHLMCFPLVIRSLVESHGACSLMTPHRLGSLSNYAARGKGHTGAWWGMVTILWCTMLWYRMTWGGMVMYRIRSYGGQRCKKSLGFREHKIVWKLRKLQQT